MFGARRRAETAAEGSTLDARGDAREFDRPVEGPMFRERDPERPMKHVSGGKRVDRNDRHGGKWRGSPSSIQ